MSAVPPPTRPLARLCYGTVLALAGAVWPHTVLADTAGQPVVPLLRAHAHNDYEHQRPLFDALEQGFCSVEADIYLVDGQLLVSHDRKGLKPERTLQALYLDPLRDRILKNGGHVYPGVTAFKTNEFTLLVDIKTDGPAVYAKLREVLAGYAGLLTHFTPDSTTPGAITVILTGDRPAELVAAEPQRLCAVDGHFSDLEANTSVHLVPLVSESWRPTFSPFKDGVLAEADRTKLRELVAKAHAQGRRIRFWGVQDKLFVWRELYADGVDLLNTDDLPGLSQYLHGQP